MIRIILIRHGRTAWNLAEGRDKRFRGMLDLPLAEDGVTQAEMTARRLAGLPLAAVYSSPLQRALSTAKILANPHHLTPQPLPGLRSMNYGDWAGLTNKEVAARWPDVYHRWCQDPFGLQVPGGEDTDQVRRRAVAAVHEVLSRHADGDTVVLVSHQVVTKTLICVLAGLPNASYWRIRQSLCNLSSFDYDPAARRFTVVGLNDTCHLSPGLPAMNREGTRLILIRHGQTAWNVGAGEERFRGRTDLPLDEVGWSQARALASRLGREPIAALYASPLLRARQTLAPLAEATGLMVSPHDGLIDIHYGRFQGMTHRQAAAAFPEAYTLWRTRPGQVCFPDGESLAVVQDRLRALLAEMAAHHPGQTVALAGHQIVNKVCVCTLLGLEMDQIDRIQQDTCGFDLFQQVDGTWRLLGANDTCHL
jgi:phosphoserine phosphatase